MKRITLLVMLLSALVAGTWAQGPRPTCGGQQPPPKTRVFTAERVEALFDLMRNPVGGMYPELQAYIIPMDDEHQMEYIAAEDRYVKFISGFSGSAGTAVVLAESGERALWTDGRYYLQAEDQLDCKWTLMKEDSGAPEISEWLSENLVAGSRIGADPKRMSALTWISLRDKLKESSLELVSVEVNLIARLWTKGRPSPPQYQIQVHPVQFAGDSWRQKVSFVREALRDASTRKDQVLALLVPNLDEVSWLLNIRGQAVPHTPVVKAYAVVDVDSVHLFVDNDKVGADVRRHLGVDNCRLNASCVMLRRYEEVFGYVAEMCQDKWRGGKVWVPSRWSYAGGASYALYQQVPAAQRLFKTSPILRMKAMKNPVEIAAMKSAHLRDSVALCHFLAMLENSIESGEKWTELSIASTLSEYRARQENFMDLSFTPIVGFGEHGAIIHYKASKETDATVDASGMLLLDSGGNYLDGTTDVTRTMHYGTPTEFQREAYTRVLMGVIDLGSVTFAHGATDSRLDILARRHLYRVGLNYLHGTGHGIGLYLQVHEAPTQLRIYQKEEHLIEEGMFFSNEPGYYEAGEFGIRLETIMYAKQAEDLAYNFSGPYLKFEPVTLVPFEPKLIKLELLSDDQLEWLNDYNALVRRRLGPRMMDYYETGNETNRRTHKWLMSKTEPLRRPRSNDECPTLGTAPDLTAVWTAPLTVLLAAVITIALRLT